MQFLRNQLWQKFFLILFVASINQSSFSLCQNSEKEWADNVKEWADNVKENVIIMRILRDIEKSLQNGSNQILETRKKTLQERLHYLNTRHKLMRLHTRQNELIRLFYPTNAH